MKAVLFSTDFAIDSDGNPRLLEVNTDTVVYPAFTSSLVLTNLTDVINSNSEITEFHVVHKPKIHSAFVNLLSSSVAANCTNIEKYGTTEVNLESLYPTNPADSGSKFILRLAYDENAVFDSTYAKSNFNTIKLMYDNDATSSIGEVFHSSSAGVLDTLTGTKGSNDYLPDYILKNSSQPAIDFQFYSVTGSVSDANTIIADAKALTSDTTYIEKYYYSPDQVTNNKVSSLRSYDILYGTDLEIIKLGSGSYDAIFNFQTGSSFRELQTSGSSFSSITRKHFYEFTTKFPQTKRSDGLLGEELIERPDGTYVSASLIESGSWVKSFFYSGSPNTDDMDIVDAWSKTGYDTPAGSLIRSASVYSTGSSEVSDSGLQQLEIEGSSDLLNLGLNTRVMVYSTSSNETSYVAAQSIDPDDHYLVNPISGSLIDITQNYFAVANSTPSFHAIDIEPDDIYFTKIGGLPIKITVTVHNRKPE